MRKKEVPVRHGFFKEERTKNFAQRVRQDTADLADYALLGQNPMHILSSCENRLVGLDVNSKTPKIWKKLPSRVNKDIIEPVSQEVGTASRISQENNIADDAQNPIPKFSFQNEPENNSKVRQPFECILNNDTNENNSTINIHGDETHSSENTPLLLHKSTRRERDHKNWPQRRQDLEGQQIEYQSFRQKLCNLVFNPKKLGLFVIRILSNPKSWETQMVLKKTVLDPSGLLPGVILGLLLNILDSLSYGMILFPLGQEPFTKLGPAGMSMFYMSCIISQLIFSCGGSKFKGGVGSEMIEVVPFFHSMAGTILREMSDDCPSAIIATTIVAYALSSVLTGAIFFLIGYFRIGYIIGFIPRHILIGCIGGVGWFLVSTGIEVTARLDTFEYNVQTLHHLLHFDTLPLWTIPLGLAVFQIWTNKILSFKHYLPAYVLIIPVVFYTFVASFGKLEISNLRSKGWIFDGPEIGEPWWYFYTLYNLKMVNWTLILKCVPAMFALTFFGIIHVPINVPSLAYAIGEDNIDLNRELLAHGASNAISGMLGSIQNYLVYTNSVIFIKSGAGSRLGGVLLALATGIIMTSGSPIIGYIPIMMVGVLIYILGIGLVKEAVWEPRKKLKWLEYLTVVVMVIFMGIYDFVIGIFVGIALAFIFLVIQTSRIPAVRTTYSGEIVGSTVRRNPVQYQYLKDVGSQIQVVKLNGYLFFGTIASVEARVRQMVERDEFMRQPIRFLVLDFYHVTGLDFSAAEVFCRINRIMSKKKIQIVMSGFNDCSLKLSLEAVELNKDNEVRMFENLNSALESCENELLKTFYTSREARSSRYLALQKLNIPYQKTVDLKSTMDGICNSPRYNQLLNVAALTLDESPSELSYLELKEPLRLMLQSFACWSEKKEDFWRRAIPFFHKKCFPANSVIFTRDDQADGFYLIQKGIMRAEYDLPQGYLSENILAGATCGELNFFADTARTATVMAECDCITWLLDRENWKSLQEREPKVAQELLRIGLKITSDRMKSITSYVLTIAG